MHQFFTDSSLISNCQALIEGSELYHLQVVLRLKVGDQVYVADNQGNRYLCQIKKISNKLAETRILKSFYQPKSNPEVVIAQALPKGKKADLIVEKTTELGVDKILFFPSAYSQVHLSKPANRQKRWRKLALAASKQSKRYYLPEIRVCEDFNEFCQELSTAGICLIFHPSSEDSLSRQKEKLLNSQQIFLVVGAEGGFTDEEIAKMEQTCQSAKVALAGGILRSETAAVTVVALVSYLVGRYDKVYGD
jgi:16S rRNA (uracil1498-N3)-methyltransferase